MQSVQRIANLLGLGLRDHGYGVPEGAVGEGFSSEVVDTPMPNMFVSEFDRSLMDIAYAQAGLRAQEQGCAAVVINTVGDYGIRPLRASLKIPVVGAGQCAMQVAAGLGERFGILTVWPSTVRLMYDRLLVSYGFAERCAGIRFVTQEQELGDMLSGGAVIDEMRAGRDAVLDRIERDGRKLVEDGADVIILGCTCMSPIQAELSARLGRPVIDPLVVAHKSAEMLVSLGLTQASPPTQPLTSGFVRDMIPWAAVTDTPADEGCGDTCAVLRDTAPEPATASA